MKLIFKDKPLVKAGYFKDFDIKTDEVKKIDFEDIMPIMKEMPISKELVRIGQVTNIKYHKATNMIRGNLEFEKRPEHTAYEPFLIIGKRKNARLKILFILSTDKSFMNFWIKWRRFDKNIRKYVSPVYR